MKRHVIPITAKSYHEHVWDVNALQEILHQVFDFVSELAHEKGKTVE